MAIYYVDFTGGLDSNDGLSTGAAWKTINKVNTKSGGYSAGDSVLFKKGETWRETLTPPSSGSNGSVITFGAYGTGAKPVINGANQWNTAGEWTHETGYLWYIAGITVDPVVLVLNGTLGVRKVTKGSMSSYGDYYYDSTFHQFYIYSNANPTGSWSDIQIGVRSQCISTSALSYITISSLQLVNTYGMASALSGGSGWTFTSCDFKYNGTSSFRASNGAASTVFTSCTFTDWGIENSTDYAIHAIGDATHSTGPVDITSCTFTLNQGGNTVTCDPIMGDEYSWVRTISGCTYQPNGHSVSAGFTINKPNSSATSITISSNTIYDPGTTGISVKSLESHSATPTVSITRNWIHNACGQDTSGTEALRLSDWASSSVTVSYNVIDGTHDGANVHHGIQVLGADGVKLYNNVIVSCDNGIAIGDLASDHSTGLDVRNNISAFNRGYGLSLAASNTITTWGYNCWYSNTSGNLSGKSAGTGDVTTDPQFMSLTSPDYNLRPGSPCHDTGTDVGLTSDHDGNAVIGTPDMGAYEYGYESSISITYEVF